MDGETVDEGENSDRPASKTVETENGQVQVMTVNLAEREVNNQDGDVYRKPQVGMQFESEDAARSFYDTYARHIGFSIHVGQFSRSKPDGPIITWDFSCSREVLKRKNVVSCNAMLRIERKDANWIVTKFVEDHNHSLASSKKVQYLRPHRHFAGATRNVTEAFDASNDSYVSMNGNHLEPISTIRSSSPADKSHPTRNIGSFAYERLAHIYLAHPSFYGELYSCINFSETVEDFESTWKSLLDKYDLQKNDWLLAVYNARKQWAPVYFRDTFFATFTSNHGYERSIEHSLEKEIEADYETICTTPVLKTPSPMEQQAANLYTKKIFAKFQEELVETFVYTANIIEDDGVVSKYRVAKYEHDYKAYMVTLNISELKANCSCQMFEYSGILCRHILTVFTVTNVLTLPSHYILKRWTRNAKSSIGTDEKIPDSLDIENLTLRFSSLCREAIKLAEEGAISIETYNAAMNAFREGAKRVGVVKKNVAKVRPPSTQGNGSSQEDNNKKSPSSISEVMPSLWPWQDSVTHHFNLNDIGLPVTDLNHPSMAPVSIHRDGGPPDNTVVLTCFKSMTWVIENNNSSPSSKVAVINIKLQDYGKSPSGETEVQFRVTRITLEPMLRSMANISQQLTTPVNRVAVISLKVYKLGFMILYSF
ncbi:Zinc finger, PMZ-type [Sesbania bispinosa]|nr:Zinc finger, PMZ-type [Sesbania bispinosa]